MKYNFRSDYLEICNQEIINELTTINLIQRDGYQDDNYSEMVKDNIKSILGNTNVDVHFMTGGTITNLTFIAHALNTYEAVIAAESGHIAVHETGAIEQTGHKVCIVEEDNGKLDSKKVLQVIEEHNDCHMVKPKLVFISNSTEYGTVYTKQELIDLYNTCKENDLYLYLDGARIFSALAAKENDLTLNDICNYTDAFYIGGTKNGAMLGEALIIKNNNLKDYFRYQIKSRGGLLAKGSLIASQFKVLFTNNFGMKNAIHANNAADIIRNSFKDKGFELVYENGTNQVFVKLTEEQYEKLSTNYGVSMFMKRDGFLITRLVTSFSTPTHVLEEFSEFLKSL